MTRKDPQRNFRFRVEIDGLASASFSEVVIGASTVEPMSYREGTDPPKVRQLPGVAHFANISLKRGMTESMELANWHRTIATSGARAARKNIAIVVMDETGADAARFVVAEAWPVKYAPGPLNAKGNEILIEELELANEGIERVA